jgi:hypothetical protein
MEFAMRKITSWLLPLAGVAALVGGVLPQAAAGVSPLAPGRMPPRAAGSPRVTPDLDWPQFLHDPQHSSVSPATAFTPANSGSVTLVWHWKPPVVTGEPAPRLDASPTVVAGHIYVGLADGCNGPHIPGGVVELAQHTGQVLATWSSVPSGSTGASVWSTAAASPSGSSV